MAMKTKMMREEIHVRNYNSWLSYTEKKFKKIQQKKMMNFNNNHKTTKHITNNFFLLN